MFAAVCVPLIALRAPIFPSGSKCVFSGCGFESHFDSSWRQRAILQFRQSYKNLQGHEMSHKTIKLALVSALEDLSKDDFEKFCHQLLDRRDEPRVRRNKVEGKSRLQIADVLVSHFTEEGALPVTVDLLKAIGCSNEADTLVSEAGGGN